MNTIGLLLDLYRLEFGHRVVGARRSEHQVAKVDFDFKQNVVAIRERKRVKGKSSTAVFHSQNNCEQSFRTGLKKTGCVSTQEDKSSNKRVIFGKKASESAGARTQDLRIKRRLLSRFFALLYRKNRGQKFSSVTPLSYGTLDLVHE